MPKNLSAKYYQENKKDYKIKACKIFLNKKKKKNDNMVLNNIKICQKMKSKILLRIEKNVME